MRGVSPAHWPASGAHWGVIGTHWAVIVAVSDWWLELLKVSLINSLAPERCDFNSLKDLNESLDIYDFQINFNHRRLTYLVNCSDECHWTLLILFGPGNVLVLSVNKPLLSQCWHNFMLPYGITIVSILFVINTLTWFPQTLKSAWIWMLSWKVLDFSICLENGRFSLKNAWKWLYGLEKYRHQKVESVSVLFCTFELRKVARFSILSSNLRHCWSSEPCFSQCRLPNQSFFV